VTKAPEPLELLFGAEQGRGMRSYTFDAGATALTPELRTTHGSVAYKAEVARNRAAAGLPEQGGEPIGIHATFQGGGGKGKRYAPALMELMQQGVVPTSASGSSVGAIAAAIVAAGADPAQLGAFVTDPRIQGFFDLDLSQNDGGLMNGNVAYEVLDDELRKLTGITDRPVTFRDLPMPLKVFAAKTADSDPAAGDMTRVEDRLFEFSQETTPDTPVALAVRASMAIPGLYDPVQMVDPTTGRQVTLVDGGAIDNLPMAGNPDGLPEVGFSLAERNSNHPEADANNAPRGPLPAGNLEAGDILWNAFNGWDLMQSAGGSADDFRDRTRPQAGQFMLSLPTWNLDDPSQGNDTLGFGYDPEVDPILDGQTREVTRAALKDWLAVLTDPAARGTNVTATLPREVAFSTPVEVEGKRYTVDYDGGDHVSVVDQGGKKKDVKLGRERIESLWLDDQAYHDLSAQLGHELKGKLGGGLFDWIF
jgi:NTE family protein